MILIHIITEKKKQALEIIRLLTNEKLILNAIISKKTMFQNENILTKKKQILIIGQTKGLLFKRINDILSSKYAHKVPMIYSLPIIYMKEDQTDFIRVNTAKI